MSFSQKILNATIKLQTGSFSGGGNSLNLSGLRMSATVVISGGEGQSYLEQLSIYGMSLSQMNQLSIIGNMYAQGVAKKNNLISVEAGDAQSGMTTIFEGYMVEAFVDANQMPEVRFMVSAQYLHWLAKKSAPVLTKPGAVNTSTLLNTLAGQMGLQFENNGINTMLSNPYLHGTAVTQVKKLAESAGFQWLIDRGTLAVWPTGGSRSGGGTEVSRQTGMVGYPRFSQASIILTTLFNPSIKVGQQINVKSDLQAACGTWNVNKITYTLDAFTPHGRWFMEIIAANSTIPVNQEPSGND